MSYSDTESWFYATGATVHKATSGTVIICFDSGNLGPVADSIRYKQPKAEIVINADHDRSTLGNPGIKAAREAAIRNRAKLNYPQFTDVSSKPTDFNNLYLLDGIDIVKEQIDKAKIPMNRPAGITASDLLNKEFPEPKWAVPGVLPEGLNFLAGKPKHGKSLMAENCSIAISSGGKALGFVDVEPGTVIYLALEDTERRLQSRIKQMLHGGRASDKLLFFTEWPQMGKGGLRALEEEIQQHNNVRLVVIGTWKLFKPVSKSGNGQNLYDLDYEAVTPVKKLSERYNISILLIHHLRKSAADDVFDTFSGTIGCL